MKTCPNPKCKATGIPDSAQFCPKCGEPLTKVSSPWAEKIEALQKERADLLDKRQALKIFSEDRDKLISRLNQDANYTRLMYETATAIQQQNEKNLKKQKTMQNVYIVLLVLACLFTAPLGIIVLAILIYKHGSISKIFDSRNEQRAKYTNEYTDTYLSPFINANIRCYQIALGPQLKALSTTLQSASSSDTISITALEREICDQEGVSKSINTKMEEIDNRIQEIEKQIETIKTL